MHILYKNEIYVVLISDLGTTEMKKTSKFVFFYGKTKTFSQFHPARFTVDGQEYNCMEQYMHHQKAGLYYL